MGTYTFRWDKAATEVFITGTFDNWSKSIQLEKVDGHFEKLVDLPNADSKIYYKFVIDGIWMIDPSVATESDASGNANNVLTPEEITKTSVEGSSGSGQQETSNTAGAVTSSSDADAATQQHEGLPPQASDLDHNDDKMPGAFPDPTPGEEAREQSFGVNPIPASGGFGNPVSLQPGEPVPPHSDVTSNTVQSTATTDKESYDQSGSAPFSSLLGAGGASAASRSSGFDHQDPTGPGRTHGTSPRDYGSGYSRDPLKSSSVEAFYNDSTGPGMTHGTSSESAGTGMLGTGAFGLPQKSDNMIPESSLPMGEGTKDTSADESPFMRSSAGADTSTSQLAGQVPLEKREDASSAFMPSSAGPGTSTSALAGEVRKEERGVPEVVQDSQESANEPPEASRSPEAVTEKQDMENELLNKVPEQQPTSEDKGVVGGALAGAGAAAVGGAAYLSQKTGLGQSDNETTSAGPSAVPEVVQESQTEAKEAPEASASPTAVAEKSEMEKELKDTVPEEKPTSEDKGVIGGAVAGAGAAAAGGLAYASEKTGLRSSTNDTATSTGPSVVPDVVKDSQAEAREAPEASASPEAVTEKSEMERELQSKVPEEQPSSQNKGVIGGAVAGAGAAATGGLAYASSKAGVPQSIQDKINSMNASASQSQPADDVPRPVTESLQQSHQSPEAAANPEAVHEKTDVERELLQDVKRTDEAGEPAPVTSAEHATMAPGTGAGVAAGMGAANAGGATYASTSDQTSSRITDPTTIPSSDPNAMLADADTMPAIAMASRDGSTPYDGTNAASGPISPGTTYSTTDTVPTSTTSTYADRSIAQPEDSEATTAAIAGGTSLPAAVIAARAMGGDTVDITTTAPVSSTSTTVPGPTTTSMDKGAFDDDPISAVGTSAPALTSDTDTLDPRTRASAFANDPISPSDGSTAGVRTVTVPAGTSTDTPTGLTSGTTSSGLNASATDPAQSVLTETKQLASDENAKPQDTTNVKPLSSKSGPTATSSIPATTGAATTGTSTTASELKPGTDTRARQDSRDVSPFSSSRAPDASSSGPQVTTGTATGGTSSKTGPSTPQKAAAQSAASKSNTPASSSSAAASPASQGQSDSAKKEKRKSRLSTFFSEHFGSERKSKK